MTKLLFFALGFFVAQFINLIVLTILAFISMPKSEPTKDEWRQF